ncbi:TPA: hypothetical protein SB604_004068 [Yersinia enterocolitica]|nr:hypothetical protein [Yersinia enterocolitica]
MSKKRGKRYNFTFAILCVSLLSSCTTKNGQRLLVYKINNDYFRLDKKCVERLYLRENRPIFYINDNIMMELDNKKECVQQFSNFINSNIGEKIHTSFNGYYIVPATKIVSAMYFDSGVFSQAVTKKDVALEIVKAYAK